MGLDQQYDLQFDIIDPLPNENIEEVYIPDKTIIEWFRTLYTYYIY